MYFFGFDQRVGHLWLQHVVRVLKHRCPPVLRYVHRSQRRMRDQPYTSGYYEYNM